MNDVMVVIPTLNPDPELMIDFLKELKKEFKKILVVNDGSSDEYNSFFEETLDTLNIKIIKNYVNLGKGRALKYAFNEILNNYPKVKYVVTCDCDGQHLVKDVVNCAVVAIKMQDNLVIGVRDFNNKKVPFKSKWGNKITRGMFKFFVGLKITDTQTGLRVVNRKMMMDFMKTSGERFDYETNMLIETKTKGIKIKEVPIETVYMDNNKKTHFNPLTDSLMIYKLFGKYILASLSSFIVDILFFILFHNWFNIMLSTVFARVLSSYYNYLINGNIIFKKTNNNSLLKYAFLVVIGMNMSGLLVSAINAFKIINVVMIKICVDILIFIVNYFIQREWVFKDKENNFEKKD